MNIYVKWGFTDNPFATVALEANEEGEKLLVGRDDEIMKIHRRLVLRPKSVTIEGNNGVGKTSLVNVAAYKIFDQFQQKVITQLLIPNPIIFQLSHIEPNEEFIDKVYYSIAQTILKNLISITKLGVKLDNITAIENYLNTYQIHSIQGSIAGFGAGESVELNPGSGFNKSGFRRIINEWLEILAKKKSGIICIIDNLELVQTSKNAKTQLEYLRDELLTKKGTHWILCGSSGIILGCASSPRLTGILNNPIQVLGLKNDEVAKNLFNTRIEYYRSKSFTGYGDRKGFYLPIESDGFTFLMNILEGNIRHALYYSDEFCLWCVDNGLEPDGPVEKRKVLMTWLREYSKMLKEAFDTMVSPKGRSFFIEICKNKGSFAYSDHSKFGFNSTQHMKSYVSELEGIELLQSVRSENDKRRKFINITPKGLILYVIGINETDAD